MKTSVLLQESHQGPETQSHCCFKDVNEPAEPKYLLIDHLILKRKNSHIQYQVCSRCKPPARCAGGRGKDHPAGTTQINNPGRLHHTADLTLTHDIISSSQSAVTFWKMKRDGNVLEMSSLIRSRLDSLSAREAPPSDTNTGEGRFREPSEPITPDPSESSEPFRLVYMPCRTALAVVD